VIRIGIVGLGFMGWIHWLAYQKLRGVRVAAVCDRKPGRLTGDWRGVRGNFGPRGRRVDLAGAATYLDWRELVRDPQVDLVDITLPTAMHAELANAALAAGKHVLCEKPMALSLNDCQRMTAAAKKAGSREPGAMSKQNSLLRAPRSMLFIAQVLPFFPEYAWALKTIRSGKYGRLRGGSFKRVICDPTWIENYWSAQHVGGPMLDLHVHDAHFIRLLFGPPTSVAAHGRRRGGMPEYWHAQFGFADRDVVVQSTCGVIGQTGRSFNHGFEIQLECATLAFEYAVIGGRGRYLCEPMLLDEHGRVRRPRLPEADPLVAFVAELREAAKCVRQGCQSELLDPTLAQDAIRICEAEQKSLFARCVVTV
jgi:predicted dehydrogenase